MNELPEHSPGTIYDTMQILPGLKPQHLQRLLLVSRSLSSTMDLPEILKMVLSAAAELTESAGASIMLIDPNGTDLRFVASSSSNQNIKDMLVPLDKSLAGWVVSNNQPVIVDNVATDERHYLETSQLMGLTINTLMAVPLRDRGEVIGVLEAFNKRDGEIYFPYDQAVAQALASQAALSITNSRLFSQSDAIAETMHELKTPLMAMTAATEMLEMQNLSDQQRSQLLKTIKQETRRLTRMTQDFLTLSRLDSGRFPLDITALDPVELAQSAIDTLEPQAEQAGIKVSLMLDQETLPKIRGDVSRLQQVLINLLSNAIKFNKSKGKVAIKLDQIEKDVWISVMDTGRGISAEDMAHLFDRFYRISHGEDVTDGTGLGLSIVKKLVEAHGGRVEVESQLGKGSAFHCIFPLIES